MCTFWNHMVYNPINNSTPNFSKTKCIAMFINLCYCCSILLTSNQVWILHDTEWQKLFYVATICSLSSPYHFFPSFDGYYFTAALVFSELKRSSLVNIIFSVVRMKSNLHDTIQQIFTISKIVEYCQGKPWLTVLADQINQFFPSNSAGTSLFLR